MISTRKRSRPFQEICSVRAVILRLQHYALFDLAAIMFPDAVKKAQKEIDSAVGTDRSPTFDDLPRMPYAEAFVKEGLRWRSLAIIGGQPHAPVQDDYYNGWFIPKDTWVQGNLW